SRRNSGGSARSTRSFWRLGRSQALSPHLLNLTRREVLQWKPIIEKGRRICEKGMGSVADFAGGHLRLRPPGDRKSPVPNADRLGAVRYHRRKHRGRHDRRRPAHRRLSHHPVRFKGKLERTGRPSLLRPLPLSLFDQTVALSFGIGVACFLLSVWL